MKKITFLILMVFGYFSNAIALEGINIGASLTAGVFEVDGAKEEFKGQHAGVGSPGDVSKSTATDGDEAEGAFAIGSVFIEYEINETVALGIDYVPHSLDSESTENVQSDMTTSNSSSNKTNTVQVDFEDLTTLYVNINLTDSMYVRAGLVKVDVITNESLGTGATYGNTDLDGQVIGFGTNVDMDNGIFVRAEANYMTFDSSEGLTSGDNTITLTNLDGVTASLKIGKSF